MNILRKSTLIALTVLGLGTASLAAQAQDTPPAGRHASAANMEQMQAKMADMFAKHQAKLHDALKLTAQQEPAWATYQAAIKPTPPTGTPPVRGAKLSAPERLSKMIEMTKQHTAKMESTLPALTAFYNTLTADQKAIFDKHAMGGHGPRRGGWGHGHG